MDLHHEQALCFELSWRCEHLEAAARDLAPSQGRAAHRQDQLTFNYF